VYDGEGQADLTRFETPDKSNETQKELIYTAIVRLIILWQSLTWRSVEGLVE